MRLNGWRYTLPARSVNRVRTRPTVDVLISSVLDISWSARPLSAFNNTSARSTLRASDLPRRATSLNLDRCDSVNSNLYFMAGMSSYILLVKSYIRLTILLYVAKSIWNPYQRHWFSDLNDGDTVPAWSGIVERQPVVRFDGDITVFLLTEDITQTPGGSVHAELSERTQYERRWQGSQ